MKPVFFDKKTCGTCKKAQGYLNEHEVAFEVVDIITTPPDGDVLERFIDADNVKQYLNSRSSIYREKKLGQNIPDKATAIQLMLEDPNLIKRPFIIRGETASFGFKEEEFIEKWL